MSAVPRVKLTPAEYLARERDATFKSEYYDGEMFAMAGGSPEHALIALNVGAECRSRLTGRQCHTYSSDLRVRITPTGLYTYPDVTIVCGELRCADDDPTTIVNPTVLFEVLSQSTEAYDRGVKAAHFRRLESLSAYVLIAQDSPQVEMHARASDGSWAISDYHDLGDRMDLPAIGLSIPLREIYYGVVFPPPSEDLPSDPGENRHPSPKPPS